MKRYYPVIRVVGVLVFSFALTLLVPLVFSWYQDDGATTAYDEAFLLTLATGAGLWWATRHEKRNLQIRDGFLLVVLVRTILPVFAALPLVPHLGCSLTAGYFEAVSGLTTTGATILTNFDTLPQSINLWRGMLVWLGGMGVIVLAVAILPLLGIGGRQMFKAETPGPMKDSKLTPRMTAGGQGPLGASMPALPCSAYWPTAGPACRGSMPSCMPSVPWASADSPPTTRASASGTRRQSRRCPSFSC
jgi:trk system potassium uptake protein TrkH